MSASSDEFLRALRPVLDSLNATLVPERSRRPGDLPVDWRGETVAYIRTVELHGPRPARRPGRTRVGGRLADLDRSTKQAAVRSLDEQGAFLLRGAVEDVSAWMGVSKVTLYSYLNAINAPRDEAGPSDS